MFDQLRKESSGLLEKRNNMWSSFHGSLNLQSHSWSSPFWQMFMSWSIDHYCSSGHQYDQLIKAKIAFNFPSNVIMIITSLIIISSPHRSSWSSPRRSLSLCHIVWCKSCHYHSKSPLLSRHLLSSLLMPNIISVTIIIIITILDNINMKQVISLPF